MYNTFNFLQHSINPMRFFTLFALFLCSAEAVKLQFDNSDVRTLLKKKNALVHEEEMARAFVKAHPEAEAEYDKDVEEGLEDAEEEVETPGRRLRQEEGKGDEVIDYAIGDTSLKITLPAGTLPEGVAVLAVDKRGPLAVITGSDGKTYNYVSPVHSDNLHLDHDFDGQLPSPDIGDGLYLDFDWEHATPEQKAANAAKRKAGAEKEFTNLNKGLNKPHATGTWWNYQADGGFKGNSKNGQRDDLTPVPLGHNAGHAFDHTRLHAHHRRTPKWLAEYRKKFPEDNQKTGLRYSDATYLNRRAEGDKIKMVSLDKAEDKDKKSEKKKKAD